MPIRKGQTYSTYRKPSYPSAKYRIKTTQRPLKNTGRKMQDLAGWRLK